MKKSLFCFLLFIFSSSLWAALPWGALSDYDQPEGTSSGRAQPAKGERYLLAQILAGEPVRVYMDLKNENLKEQKIYREVVFSSYNRWFSETASKIRAAKREAEFADILPVLDTPVQVEFTAELKQADIVFQVHPIKEIFLICGKSAIGCYERREGKKPIIHLPQKQVWVQLLSVGSVSPERVGMHEMGHSLGLSDQYEQAGNSDTHRRYSSAQSGKGVMAARKKFTCDEADGMINLIDITRGTERGGDTGWHSLCKQSKEYYIRGQSALHGPYMITSDDFKNWKVDSYQAGKLISAETYPLVEKKGFAVFSPIKETVRQRDAFSRPVLAEGPSGEKIYYSYLYDQTIRLVLLKNQVLLAEVKYPQWEKSKKKEVHSLFFKRNGNDAFAGIMRMGKGKGGVVYLEENAEKEVALELNIMFNSKGDPVERYLQGEKMQRKNQPLLLEENKPFSSGLLRSEIERKEKESQRQQLKQQLIKWFQAEEVLP